MCILLNILSAVTAWKVLLLSFLLISVGSEMKMGSKLVKQETHELEYSYKQLSDLWSQFVWYWTTGSL